MPVRTPGRSRLTRPRTESDTRTQIGNRLSGESRAEALERGAVAAGSSTVSPPKAQGAHHLRRRRRKGGPQGRPKRTWPPTEPAAVSSGEWSRVAGRNSRRCVRRSRHHGDHEPRPRATSGNMSTSCGADALDRDLRVRRWLSGGRTPNCRIACHEWFRRWLGSKKCRVNISAPRSTFRGGR
jgi:hypothetical protein